MMHGLVWLASYPKSGNTWVRLLLSNFLADSESDINQRPGMAGVASARGPFDALTMLDSGDLTDGEICQLRPQIHRAVARRSGDLPLLQRMWKTHDAWTVDGDGVPILADADAGSIAILVVRDPRDVVASLAHHQACSRDDAIALMANPHAALSSSDRAQAFQLRQRLSTWSGFNASWLDQSTMKCHVVRYEELHSAAEDTLAGILSLLDIDVDRARIQRAIDHTSFARLQAQEHKSGFAEAPPNLTGAGFFRRGAVGGWRDELTAPQAARIVGDHEAMMQRLGYAV